MANISINSANPYLFHMVFLHPLLILAFSAMIQIPDPKQDRTFFDTDEVTIRLHLLQPAAKAMQCTTLCVFSITIVIAAAHIAIKRGCLVPAVDSYLATYKTHQVQEAKAK